MIYVLQKETHFDVLIPRGKGSLSFQKYKASDYNELNNVLSKIKEKHVAVLGRFPSFLNELITIPKVKENLLQKLILREAKNRFSNIKAPILTHKKLTDITKEGVTFNQVFLCVIETEETDEILSAIVSAGKECVYISILSLVLSQIIKGYLESENCFVACDLPHEKVFMLFSPNDLSLVRIIPSETKGFDLIDYENINQTISFCRESLRIFPSKVLFYTPAKDTVDFSKSIIPSELLTIGSGKDELEEDYIEKTILEFLDKKFKELTWTNFLPSAYLTAKKKLKVYSGVFLFGSLVAAVMFYYVFTNGIKAKQTMEEVGLFERRVQAMLPVFEEYKKAKDRLDKFLPVIDFHNRILSARQVYPVMDSVLNFFDNKYRISEVDAKREDAGITVRIKGTVVAEGIGFILQDFDKLIEALSKNPGFKIIQSSIDVKTKNFSIVIQASN